MGLAGRKGEVNAVSRDPPGVGGNLISRGKMVEEAVEECRISVRELVEFTHHGEDIRPGGGLRDMQEGMLGHKARQRLLGDNWTAEKPVFIEIPVQDPEPWRLVVGGRMDAWREDPPCVEEIKLWQGREPPVEPATAHWAQCACYGAMVCKEETRPWVGLRVVYVDRRGKERACFEETWTAERCQALFDALAEAYLARERIRRTHVLARNGSLASLRFPFAAYRAGQREMAVQVYTAIRRHKRLFASMPTGTGKSTAALFPALKALGEGLTGQVYYLTARTTQRQGALEAVERMRAQGMNLWVLTLNAKERQCPHPTVCHPDWCPRARGHFLRDQEALLEMLHLQDWTGDAVRAMADKHLLCPFEFSLSLAELADVVICDYNYAFDPAVHIQRIFDRRGNVTLLVDEAHNLLGRAREMLSGKLDGAALRRLRQGIGKAAGRRHPLYKALTELLRRLNEAAPEPPGTEARLEALPQKLAAAAEDALDALQGASMEGLAWGDSTQGMGDIFREVLGFVRVMRRDQSGYAYLVQGRRDVRLTVLALDVAATFGRRLRATSMGAVSFSADPFSPLQDMKCLLGGGEEGRMLCHAVPFPQGKPAGGAGEHQYPLCAPGGYRGTDRNPYPAAGGKPSGEIYGVLSQLCLSAAGGRLAGGSSHGSVKPPPWGRWRRDAFLAPYLRGREPVLSLCVLGGIFAEGIDLPGTALDGVMVVGVGLPQVNLFQETLRAYYQEKLGQGFAYAYRIPGMQKVAQAVGRVIRTETDRGVALLLDDRYLQREYRQLCPEHWTLRRGNPQTLLKAFWREKSSAP